MAAFPYAERMIIYYKNKDEANMKKTISILSLLLLILIACQDQPVFVKTGSTATPMSASSPDNGTIMIQGTIVHKSIEGGFFAIESNDGKTYDPVNLPEAFKKGGLKVKVKAKLRKDMGSIRMVGDSIEIIDIAIE